MVNLSELFMDFVLAHPGLTRKPTKITQARIDKFLKNDSKGERQRVLERMRMGYPEMFVGLEF